MKDEPGFLAFVCRPWETRDFMEVGCSCCLCGAALAINAMEAIELLHEPRQFEFVCQLCAALSRQSPKEQAMIQ